MRGFAIGGRPPFGDVGDSIEVYLELHPYLHCFCGTRLYHGQATTGATVLVCHACERILDTRRVA
jgi:hypothetical protein